MAPQHRFVPLSDQTTSGNAWRPQSARWEEDHVEACERHRVKYLEALLRQTRLGIPQ
ncbi:MAG TPA: hypothetical protein VG248_03470 [Caulobacteraceae bacterium]|jgi:hypothetical protein|nr:hypothetical protein [Caulobacteraceae bacterium]